MLKRITVVGSINIDLFMKVKRFPKPGETIVGNKFLKVFGGKGANQAIAAAKTGAAVSMISKVGDDDYGKEAIVRIKEENINVDNILIDDKEHSGVAMIWVDETGENSIVVDSGANANLNPDEILKCRDIIVSSDILLTQLEVPLDTIQAAIDIAFNNGVKVILNPAPAVKLKSELLSKVSVITPNVNEIEALTGFNIKNENDILKASNFLYGLGVKNIIVTNGENGFYLYDGRELTHIPAFEVVPIDTTAAGDVFNGILCSSLIEEQDILKAAKFANAGAALSVSKIGSQNSIPSKLEIIEFLHKQNHTQLKPMVSRTKYK